jgi:hypothetical protein
VGTLASDQNRRLALLFGVLAAILLIASGLIAFIGGFVFLALGFGGPAIAAWGRSVLDVVVGIVVGAFSLIGRSGPGDRALTSGVILIVIAIVGWFGLGLANGILGLLATLFCLIAGLIYLLAAR